MPQLADVFGRAVGEGMLGFGPHEFVRVKLRSIGREPMRMESFMPEHKFLDDDAPVDRASIPQQHHRPPQMTQEIAQESNDFKTADVGAVKAEVESQAFARWGNGDGRYRGYSIPPVPE